MSELKITAEGIVGRVQAALDGADLHAIGGLLDPNVRWGVPDDPDQSCKKREQVLTSYRRGREARLRARVTETVGYGDGILVELAITAHQAVGGEGIIETCGFDSSDDATARAAAGLAQ